MFETLPERERPAPERTDVISRAARERRGKTTQQRRRRQRVTVRRVKRNLRHVDPLAVFKLSLFFYALAVVAWMIFAAIVYSFIEGMGLFDSIEEISRGLALGWRVEIDLWFVEKWALVIGLVFWLVGSLMNLLIAFLFNVGADMIGGVDMTFVERET